MEVCSLNITLCVPVLLLMLHCSDLLELHVLRSFTLWRVIELTLCRMLRLKIRQVLLRLRKELHLW